MKKMLVVLAAMAFVIAMVGSALANSTSDVGVSAKVSNTCSVLATMTIAEIPVDLSLGGPFTGSTSGNVKCTNNNNFQINVSSADVTTPTAFIGGTGVAGFKMKGTGTNTDVINYSVISGGDVVAATGIIAGQGFGSGKDRAVGITASIENSGTNKDVTADTYSDTVYLTIVY